jgi:Rrf2 family transcriptional regulator, iron-sulfur cluster assembly transcription factor
MFGKTVRYALVALTHMARRMLKEKINGPFQVSEIQYATKIPRSYLSKILQYLTKEGVLQSVRGTLGGYRFAKAIDKLTLGDVIATLPEDHCGKDLQETTWLSPTLKDMLYTRVIALQEEVKALTFRDVVSKDMDCEKK